MQAAVIKRSIVYFPVSQDLADHVKRLDGFNEEEISKLKNMLYGLVEQEVGAIPDDLPQDIEEIMQITLKLNQVYALLDIQLSKAQSSPEKALEDIQTQLAQHGGLDYIPRERTPQGRLFEHASDSRSLLRLLHQTRPAEKAVDASSDVYYIKLTGEHLLYAQSAGSTSSVDSDGEIVESKEALTLFTLQREFVELTLKANGKADLYFHAYFWHTFASTLYQRANLSPDAEPYEKVIGTKSVELQRLRGLSEFLKKVHANIAKHAFTHEVYDRYVAEFGGRKQVKSRKLLEDLQKSLMFAMISDDKDSLHWIERILIQLLGYSDINVRDQAVVFLNMLYDGVDWQLSSAFRPVVRVVGQHFKVNVLVDHDLQKDKDSQIFIGLSAPSPIEGVNQTILTWHKIDQRNIVASKGIETEISINFGKFWKCGFYDWRIVVVRETGRLQPLDMLAKQDSGVFSSLRQSYSPDFYSEQDDVMGQQAQGRFIVHAKGMRDHIFHEVYVDYQGAEVDTKEGKFVKRGDFAKVEKAMDGYKKRGITALYLMGVLERDNNPYLNKVMNEVEFRKPDAAPLAITCRQTANKMLGGEDGFQRVMKQAKQAKIKVVVDCLTRISSSRNHRKYRDLMLHYLDEEGKKRICYGTDGQSINYEDTALLNYRKLESWDLLIGEVVAFSQRHGVNGIHLDNGQAWPQIMEVDLEELMRLDVDGQPAYTPTDVLNGEVVIRNENWGFWNTNTMDTYANPFFIKMCRRLWEELPDFMILGECWGGFKFENRHILLARSGIIPRMYKLPQAICSVFGKRLFKDGRVISGESESVKAINDWYEKSKRQFLPEGSILLQSSSAHQWPYPAFLYGKGSWAAVDILYFMPDVPITFMGELDGEVYRIETTKVFQHEQLEVRTGGLKRTNSQLKMLLQEKDAKDEYQPSTTAPSTAKGSASPTSPAEKDSATTQDGERRGMLKVSSRSNLAAIVVEQKGQDLKYKEDKFKQTMDPRQGFDLSKISSHYEHRCRLRREKMVLRYGEFIPLVAKKSDTQLEERVLTYARYSLQETAIIATNLNDFEVQFYIDLSPLEQLYLKTYIQNNVVMVTDWLNPDAPVQYYFLKELLAMKQYIRLRSYRSTVLGITICSQDGDSFVIKKALTQSIERTKQKLTSGQSIESEQISLLFTDILQKSPYDIVKFANVIGSLQENFLDKMTSPALTFYDLLLHNDRLKKDPILSSRLIALCERIVEISDGKILPPQQAAQSIVTNNKLGPIVFCAPELGRWSTVGGLGVMVDELSIGLAALGQDVYVISPYYERNRKGETGYLARDPAGITYKENIHVQLNVRYTLGVHEGEVSGVKVIFLHNSDCFPSPYADMGPADVVRQLAVFGKGCLEFCCARKLVPSVCVTNDWFTGLVPAYAKIGHFGDTFRGTTFFHIVHNLEPTYEGRIFPNPNQGALEYIHQLPHNFFVDPQWSNFCVNPSRCALMNTDSWGTVSPSYLQDLLRESPLNHLLKNKPNPFAFPNGIPIEARIKKLDDAAPDHLTAKRLIQKKYFGFGELDDSVPLLAFVGRITAQKGVHLILDAAEALIHKSGFKINILVGGAYNPKEPYSANQAHKMWQLAKQYPNNFWADPNQFFTDGSLVNRGSDFGLMPSVFEPGGIVQHEFFVGGTPVIAYKTGGLKDSVFEFSWDTEKGNGYTFESHNVNDYIYACERALGTFKNKAKYLKLRQNAFDSTMEGERVSRAWLGEFYRLRGKVFVDHSIVRDTLNKMSTWSPASYKPMTSFEEMFGIEKGLLQNFALDDIDFGAEEEKEVFEDEKGTKVVSHFENPKDDKFPHVFTMHNNGPRYRSVELCGTFDNWKTRHQMSFDSYTNQWFITLHLGRGKYHYKYVVDGNKWIVNEKEPRDKDTSGNINNVLNL